MGNINIYFPKSNRSFTSKSGCINHINSKKVYATHEEAYYDVFGDESDKILYEIKPDSNRDIGSVPLKEKYAIEWAEKNGYVFTYIGEEWFYEHVDYDIIDKVVEYCDIEPDVIEQRMRQFLEKK